MTPDITPATGAKKARFAVFSVLPAAIRETSPRGDRP
jgi:hypothetical protein